MEMEPHTEKKQIIDHSQDDHEEHEEKKKVREMEGNEGMVLDLPLGEVAAATFDLERAVCSHGLFMMAPNHWDPHTKTLIRPLHLSLFPHHDDDSTSSSSSPDSVLVRISHPPQNSNSLRINVYGNHSLSSQQQQSILAQVGRMLHLSEAEERIFREFQGMMMMHKELNSNGVGDDDERSFSGRVFRSPTLFEDMVKCMLLCNCQWPRTLSMARALCELQLELQLRSSRLPTANADGSNSTGRKSEPDNFIPKTPAVKESKKGNGVCKISKNFMSKFIGMDAVLESNMNFCTHLAQNTESIQQTEKISPMFLSSEKEDYLHEHHNSSQSSTEFYNPASCLFSSSHTTEERDMFFHNKIGNFPSPKELASLDESFLAKRCNLGYRARRILNLAQSIVDGRIQLEQLDKVCSGASSFKYNELAEQLKQIDGFGPFTCLVCMGFYHVIPSDSETIRHIKQVHARSSTTQTVARIVENIYKQYAPFQFLTYWSEVWHFYEKRFGKLSEMPPSNYKLITASNMRLGRVGKCKRLKITHEEGSLINSNDKNEEDKAGETVTNLPNM